MELRIVVEQELDGRWIAEIPEIPGVLVYGATRSEALSKAEVLALRVLADRIEHADAGPLAVQILLPDAA